MSAINTTITITKDRLYLVLKNRLLNNKDIEGIVSQILVESMSKLNLWLEENKEILERKLPEFENQEVALKCILLDKMIRIFGKILIENKSKFSQKDLQIFEEIFSDSNRIDYKIDYEEQKGNVLPAEKKEHTSCHNGYELDNTRIDFTELGSKEQENEINKIKGEEKDYVYFILKIN